MLLLLSLVVLLFYSVIVCFLDLVIQASPCKLSNQGYICLEGVKSIICFHPEDDLLIFFLWLCGRGRRN